MTMTTSATPATNLLKADGGADGLTVTGSADKGVSADPVTMADMPCGPGGLPPQRWVPHLRGTRGTRTRPARAGYGQPGLDHDRNSDMNAVARPPDRASGQLVLGQDYALVTEDLLDGLDAEATEEEVRVLGVQEPESFAQLIDRYPADTMIDHLHTGLRP